MCEEAYVAAFIDGEGSIGVRENGYPHLIIANTDLPVLRWIQAWAGVGRITAVRSKPGYKQVWHYDATGVNAQQVLQRVLPWLHIKADKAKQGLTWIPKGVGRPSKKCLQTVFN